MVMEARPTTYSGIQMRSRLEATVASNLDAAGVSWEYEPGAFGGPGMQQWLPDFRLDLTSGRGQLVYVEVKGTLAGPGDDRIAARRRLMTRMGVVWESQEAVLAIVEAEWQLDESNPHRHSFWAGTPTSGWAPAHLVRCTTCEWSRIVHWRGTVSDTHGFAATRHGRRCDARHLVPTDLLRRTV